ncbi:MAG: hypothetical protein ACPKQO_07180 [Nitrososphaeraceae archaeon]
MSNTNDNNKEKELSNTNDTILSKTNRSTPKIVKDYGLPLGVMAISLFLVYVLWLSFGYIGPSFSDDILKEQQITLREKYNLPPAEIPDAAKAEIPPSLRDLPTETNITS